MATHAPTTPTPSNRSAFPTRTSSLNPVIPSSLFPSRTSTSSILQAYTPSGATAGASSSSLYLHHSEDPLIFEIGSRLLRAGFANEGTPRCELEWTNEVFWSREGYIWSGSRAGKEAEGRGELWSGDLRNVEMGVVEDVVERGIRMAYNKYLLLDSKIKRVIIVIPTCFPTVLITSLTKSFFVHFQMPGIMLLESPIMSAMGAGVRSALVLDLGWEEAVVNVVYELRIVGRGGARGRSRRGGKVLRGIWKEFLEAELKKNGGKGKVGEREVEEVLSRVGWCRAFREVVSTINDTIIEIPLSTSNPPTTLKIPFSRLSEPAENTFFAPSTTPSSSPDYPDDDDHPIPRLVYEALKDSPMDVRAACMQRIIIVGGASQVPGLKKRIVDEVRDVVEAVGWQLGQRRDKNKPNPPPPNPEPSIKVEIKHEINSEDEGEIEGEQYEWHASLEGQSPGRPADEKKELGDDGPKVKGLESLGAWVGASLVAGMKWKGNIEVDREKFLSTVASGGSGFPFGF